MTDLYQRRAEQLLEQTRPNNGGPWQREGKQWERDVRRLAAILEGSVGRMVALIREERSLLPWENERRTRIMAELEQIADYLDPANARPERPSERAMRLASHHPGYRR